jgi:hypothetical protein
VSWAASRRSWYLSWVLKTEQDFDRQIFSTEEHISD